MLIFGLNLPLPEMFFVLVLLFLAFLIMILLQLRKLQKMTTEEKSELEELERIAQDEKHDITEIRAFEEKEAGDILELEKDITDLEEDTDTIYLKRLAPDLYKIQNYTLWALSKSMPPSQIKQNLLNRGWKDSKMITMVIEDTMKYTGHLKKVDFGEKEPAALATTEKSETHQDKVHVVETTHIIKPVRVITMKESVRRKKAKKKTGKKTGKKSKDDFNSIEKELKVLEKDLKKKPKKAAAKAQTVRKAAAKPKKKIAAKKKK